MILCAQEDGATMRKPPKDQLKQGVALAALLIISGFAIAGPTGLLTWNESEELLEQRKAQIAEMRSKSEMLKNKVDRLHPDGADPDLVGELLRENMNVVHPDEVVITLEEE